MPNGSFYNVMYCMLYSYFYWCSIGIVAGQGGVSLNYLSVKPAKNTDSIKTFQSVNESKPWFCSTMRIF